ncbi:hypothetical protein CKAH01_07141 [Colletotrichum kahawae]|uniref:Uncharacterized protein n=1 Tax=Colletotrichum kahawae TaxID=34407 RepID=A0AAE0D1I6_COLKA|nr:hypothetical protein CKAH01_07141 [Colletotrichum kahawae]
MIYTIFQIIRFFLIKVELYVYIFYLMLTDVFLKIICVYLHIFKLALSKIERCFTYSSKRGLNLPHSKAIAVMDCLRGYIFTGHNCHLPRMVLQLLSIINSLCNRV